jgi:polyhydroxyalkanoate synthesis regulator phasin
MTAETGDRGGRGDRGLDSLYREVRRIREIAESREDVAGSRVAELTREVEELRATVARLRGSAMAGPAR